MIRELPESEDSVLGFEITGKVTLEEEKKWLRRFDAVLKEHGKISVLVVLVTRAFRRLLPGSLRAGVLK